MTGIISAITSVWTELSNFMVQLFGDVQSLFYVASGENAGLTMLGFLAIVAVGIGLFTLVMNYIKDFLRLR